MTLPLILVQNHIAGGEHYDFPAGNPKLFHNFGGRVTDPPLQANSGLNYNLYMGKGKGRAFEARPLFLVVSGIEKPLRIIDSLFCFPDKNIPADFANAPVGRSGTILRQILPVPAGKDILC